MECHNQGTAACNRTKKTSSTTQNLVVASLYNMIAPSQHLFSWLQHKAGHYEKLLTFVFNNSSVLFSSGNVAEWASAIHLQKSVRYDPSLAYPSTCASKWKIWICFCNLCFWVLLFSPMLQAVHPRTPVLSQLLKGSPYWHWHSCPVHWARCT